MVKYLASPGAGDVPRAPLFSGGLGRTGGTERLHSWGEAEKKGTASSEAGGGPCREGPGGGSSSTQHPPAKKKSSEEGLGESWALLFPLFPALTSVFPGFFLREFRMVTAAPLRYPRGIIGVQLLFLCKEKKGLFWLMVSSFFSVARMKQ